MRVFKYPHIPQHDAACQENIRDGWDFQGRTVAGEGNAKVSSKPVALVKFYNTIKSQISSTKLQINFKSQYSMTKTF
jgi:hypothetical protein